MPVESLTPAPSTVTQQAKVELIERVERKRNLFTKSAAAVACSAR